MQKVHIIKVGGQVLKNDAVLHETIRDIASIEAPVILVHGGGKHVDQWMARLGAEVQMIDGRRITDALSLELAVMNYAGLINKNMVALLEKQGKSALGLSGADLHCIRSKKRQHPVIDFGYVGDVTEVNAEAFMWLLEKNIIPVCCAITCDENAQLLNTNADTIAAEIAIALAKNYQVNLWYCFEKKGVLKDINDDESLIDQLEADLYESMLRRNLIHTGMKPKLQNCYRALDHGVDAVYITDSEGIKRIPLASGTKITR